MPRREKQGFIWVPRAKNTRYAIYIDGVDVTRKVISSEWSRSIIGLESQCKLTLIDSKGTYANTYVGGETVELMLAFGNADSTDVLFESYDVEYGSLDIYGSEWYSQTFTVGTVATDKFFLLNSLKLKIKRDGNPGEIAVSIRAVGVDGKPTGDDLSTGTIAESELGTSYSLVEVIMSAVTLSASTQYAIVIGAASGNASNKLKWSWKNLDGYAGGGIVPSSDSGSSWGATSNTDATFYVYGAISQWKGKLEAPKKKFGEAYTLELVGSHYQSDLLDLTVTESYSGSLTSDEILKDLVDTYLTGYTYTNVGECSVAPTISWDNKPLWDCIVDLCELSTFDAYLDSDKDFHFFEKESITNEIDAIVWRDNMLEIESLGTDTIDVKNRIIVYGEDDAGLPIVYRTDDLVSQAVTGRGIKEEVIKDTSIKTYQQAKERGDAELALKKSTATGGSILSIILPDINPGDMLYVTNPVQHINGTYRVVQYTHLLPIEQTKVIISKDRTIPQLFKDNKKSELRLQKITNPYKMTKSYNFTFDNLDNVDQTLSSAVTVDEGKLKISSGVQGIMISDLRSESTDITYVQLKVVGDALAGTEYYVSTDNADTWDQVNLEEETAVTAGTDLRIKIILNSTSTLIDSLAVLYR